MEGTVTPEDRDEAAGTTGEEASETAAATPAQPDAAASPSPQASDLLPMPLVPQHLATQHLAAGQRTASALPAQDGETDGAAVEMPDVAAGAAPRSPASRRAETGFEMSLAAAAAADATTVGTPASPAASPTPAPGDAPAGGAAPVPGTGATPAAQAPATNLAPVPLGAVPMTIGLRALGAASRFEIRLDPVELGRIDIALDIDRDSGTVGARLTVDRPETLALLQRDASSLQQALAQTGLDASAGISVSLRDGGDGRRDGGTDAGGRFQTSGRDGIAEDRNATTSSGIAAAPLRAMRGYGGLDIRI